MKISTSILQKMSKTYNNFMYYENIKDASSYVSGLVPVFVHEMFHAWNFFEAGKKKKNRDGD